MNGDGDANRYIHKIDHEVVISSLGTNVETLSGLKPGD